MPHRNKYGRQLQKRVKCAQGSWQAMCNNGKHLVTSVGGPVPVSLRRGLTVWGMTKAGRDWHESMYAYIVIFLLCVNIVRSFECIIRQRDER